MPIKPNYTTPSGTALRRAGRQGVTLKLHEETPESERHETLAFLRRGLAMKRHTAIRLTLALFLITGFFSGWPQIFGFPPMIQEAYAAFPYVPADASGTKTSQESGDTYTPTIDLPTSIASGDLIIAFFGKDHANTATWPSS